MSSIRSHLKKRILVQDQGGREYQTGGIRRYFEDLIRTPNAEIGPKDFFEIASISFTRFVPLMLLTVLLAAGCASTSYIEVTYQLPEPKEVIGKKTVFLDVVDRRPDKEIAGPNARKELEYFTGLFSLYVERNGQKPILAGAFELTALFKEALTQRLESEGITIIDKKAADKAAIEFQINEFILDRDGKYWKATLAYKAVTSKDGRILTNQTVAGNAERLKIIGTRDAEKLLGEIFSDMVNRLDPEKLFNHPDL